MEIDKAAAAVNRCEVEHDIHSRNHALGYARLEQILGVEIDNPRFDVGLDVVQFSTRKIIHHPDSSRAPLNQQIDEV